MSAPEPFPGEPVRERGGYQFFTGSQDSEVVLGMAHFTPGEARRLSRRILWICAAIQHRSRGSQPADPQPVDTTFISDKHETRVNQALGYAWGQSDALGVPTAGGHLWLVPALAFARAYADARTDTSGPSVQGAYDAWQASDGTTVIQP